MSQTTAERFLITKLQGTKGMTGLQIIRLEPKHSTALAAAFSHLATTGRLYQHPLTGRWHASAIA